MVNRGKYSLRGLCFVDNQRHSRRRRCVLPGALVGRAVRSSLKAPQRVKTSLGTSCSDGIFADHTSYFREWIRTDLELYNLWPLCLAALLVPGCVHRVAGPESAALPAGFLIVDASRRVSRVESQRV